MSNDQSQSQTPPCHSQIPPCHFHFNRMECPKKQCMDYMCRLAIDPYKANSYGNDMITSSALKFAHWKNENVFPVDLKLRAPAVLFSSMLFVKSWLISVSRI